VIERLASCLAPYLIFVVNLLPLELPIGLLFTRRVALIVVMVFIIIVVPLVAVPV
jgi:hypothetical protein